MNKKRKSKSCKVCELKFIPARPLQNVCSPSCALKYNTKKEVDKRVKQMKKDIVKKSTYENILQKQINTIVRLIDKGHECITSGSKNCVFHAGHFISVGSNPTLRYNLLNIYAQSEQDNWHKGGKGSNYGIRLKEIFGIEVRDEIESLPSKYVSINLTALDLINAIHESKQIIIELKQATNILTLNERIMFRKSYNERIGIYK